MARLVLTTPEGQETVALSAHNTLGRHPNNSVQLLDKIVSKEHCIIVQSGNDFILQDLGSLNGTFINGERVAGERLLRDGDEIALGSTRALFHLATDDPAQASNPPLPGVTRPWDRDVFHPAVAHVEQVPSAPASIAGVTTEPLRKPLTSANTASQALVRAGFPQPSLPQTGEARGGTSPRVGANKIAVVPTTGTQQVRALQPERRETLHRTRVDLSDAGHSIGNQVDATARGFLPYQDIASNPTQLAADYERLRFSHELSREIALERDLTSLLNKILISVFRLIRADRGVIFLRDDAGDLVIGASLRRDGSGDAITVSSTILEHVMKERATVLTHDAAMDFAGSKGKSMILNRISSAIVAPLLHNDELLGVLWLDSETLAQFQARDLEMVSSIAAQAAMFIEISILGRKIEQEIVARERFSRLLSPNVAEKVLSGEMIVKRGGQAVNDCTVFNSDIRGFTPMSERVEPEVLVEILNEYFELMVESIFKFEGTLDKFMGDGIMALWGAPVAHPDDAFRAVSSAIEQMRLLEEFNQQRSTLPNHIPLRIGVGIHTGKVVAGYIGSSKALSYTVIGDTANTSARLCGIAGPGQVLVSDETLKQLNGRFPYRELPATQLKGKERPFKIYEILQIRKETSDQVAELGHTPTPSASDRTRSL